MAIYRGACQCGAIAFHFDTKAKREHWPVRVCQCEYCRPHNAGRIHPPFGRVHFQLDPAHYQRFRHGLFATDFLICPHCATYIGSIMRERTGSYAVLNLATLIIPGSAPGPLPSVANNTIELTNPEEWTPVVSVI